MNILMRTEAKTGMGTISIQYNGNTVLFFPSKKNSVIFKNKGKNF